MKSFIRNTPIQGITLFQSDFHFNQTMSHMSTFTHARAIPWQNSSTFSMSGTNYSLLWLLYLLSTATFTEANARVFDVYRTSDWKTNGIIKYQGASANTFGSSINLGTGIFTAPEKGVYRFTFTGQFYTPSGNSKKLLNSSRCSQLRTGTCAMGGKKGAGEFYCNQGAFDADI